MTESETTPPGLTARLGAAWGRSKVRAWFTWPRVRNGIAITLLVFLLTRVLVGLLLDFALTRATEGALGLKCRVGHTALNLTAGSAVLGDVALLSSSGTPIATIGRAELELSWTSLPNLIVERIAIEDVEVYLKRDATGALPALAGLGGAKQPAKANEAAAKPGAKPAAGPLPVVLLKRMRVTHIRVHWEDETVKPTFKGELLLDMRADEIATFSRPEPPSFSLRLASPGVLDRFNLDVAGRTLEDGASAFDILVGAEAHPSAIAPYFGQDVQVHARTLALALEGHLNLRPSYLEGRRFYTGALTVERASIKADDDEADLGQIIADLTHVTKDRVDIARIAIAHPRFSFAKLADGTLRVLGFGLKGKSKKTDEPPPPKAESSPLPVIKLGELALTDGKLEFFDESLKTPITIDLEYQATVNEVVIDPDSPGHRARLEASASLPGIIEKMTCTGSFVPVGTQRDLTLDMKADGITLATIAPYLRRSGFEPDLKRGSASGSLHAQAVSTTDGALTFSAEITKAKYKDEDELMGMRALRVEGGHLAADGALVIDTIAIDDPLLDLHRHKSGAISVAGIRTTKIDPNDVPAPVAEAPEEAPSAESANAPAPKQGKIRINEILVSGGKIGWKDDALEKPMQVAVDAGTFQLTGLVLGEPGAAPAQLRASASVKPSIGDVVIEASLIPDPGAPAISGTFTARDVSPKPLAAYLKAYSIDPTLERGRLEAGLYAKASMKGGAIKSHLLLAPLSMKSGVNELGSIASIELANTSIDPATHTTNLGDLTITGVRARAYRDAQGAINTLGIRLNPRPAGEVAAEASASQAGAPAPVTRKSGILRMGQVALKDLAFNWHDEMTTPPSDVRLERFDVVLGPRRLDVDARPGDDPVPLRIHAEVDRVATFDVDAGVIFAARAPIVRADMKVTDLTLSAVAGYLAPSGYVPAFSRGTFEGRIDTTLSFEKGITGAVVELTKWKLQDQGKELLGLDHARIPFELDSVGRTFHTGEIVFTSPRLVAEKTKEGDLLACGLLMKKKAADAAPAPAPAPKGPEPKPLATSIDAFQVDGLVLDWRDNEAGGAHFEIKDGSIEMGRLLLGKKLNTPWKLKGDLGDLGALEMSGTAMIATQTIVEADFLLTRMKGREISPYLGEGNGLDLNDGSFVFKLSYSAEPAAAGGQKMSVALTNVALEEKGTLLLGWDALRADLARSDGVKQVYVIDALELENFRGEVTKLPEGRARNFGFDKRPVAAAPPPKRNKAQDAAHLADPPPLPTVELKKLAFAASRITVRDRSSPNAGEPPPYQIQNLLVRNTAPFLLQSDDPTTAILDLAATAESGGTYESAALTFHALPFDSEPQARMELDIKGLSGDAIMKRSPGLAQKYDFSAWKSATAHMGLNFNIKSHERIDMLGQALAPLAFEMTIDALEVRSVAGGPVVFGIDDMRVDVSSYDLATGAMVVKKVEMANPVGVFAKENDGFRSVDYVTRREKVDPNAPVEPAPQAAKPALQRYDRIIVSDGEIAYIDSTLAPILDFPMRAFEIDILGYTNQWKTSKTPMNILVRSRGGCYDDLKFKSASLAFFPYTEGDFEARILQLPLDRLNCYVKEPQKFEWKGGKIDVEMKGSFRKSHCKAVCRITLYQPEVEELPGILYPVKTPLGILEDENGEVFLEVPLEFDLDADLKIVKGSWKFDYMGVLGDAAKAIVGSVVGDVKNIFTGKKEGPKNDAASRKRPPVPFGPVEAHVPDASKAELDELAEHLKADPLFYVALRGEIGHDDARRAKLLASPAVTDRRDLIARLEADRARLERRRADAISEVRGSLQAGADDVGAGRSHLTDVTARLQKVDKSLEDLYEQEREGAERSAERRAREIEAELCDNRVEAIAAYMVSKGAPVDRIKRRPAKLKPIEHEGGIVAIEVYTAHRKAIDRSAVKQDTKEPAGK